MLLSLDLAESAVLLGPLFTSGTDADVLLYRDKVGTEDESLAHRKLLAQKGKSLHDF